jgi:shikimate dehydrogenase
MATYGLIGKSLRHSFSQVYFTEKFEREGRKDSYLNFELQSITDFPMILREYPDLVGLNVTIPYKEAIIPFLTDLDTVAKVIGAVNTISIKEGKCVGFNTDAFGFRQAIKPFLRNIHERALILGTGGAAKAVAHVLEEIGLEVFYLTRNPKKLNEFAYSDANHIMLKSCKLIVNCTPLGTYPNTEEIPPIPLNFIAEDHLVIDLIYNPAETKLLRIAKKQGADTLNGVTMLREQAEESFRIWNAE